MSIDKKCAFVILSGLTVFGCTGTETSSEDQPVASSLSASTTGWAHLKWQGVGGTISLDYLPGPDSTLFGGAQPTLAAWLNVTLDVNQCPAADSNWKDGVLDALVLGEFDGISGDSQRLSLHWAEANPCRYTAEFSQPLLIKYFTGGRNGRTVAPRYMLAIQRRIAGYPPGWLWNGQNDSQFFSFAL